VPGDELDHSDNPSAPHGVDPKEALIDFHPAVLSMAGEVNDRQDLVAGIRDFLGFDVVLRPRLEPLDQAAYESLDPVDRAFRRRPFNRRTSSSKAASQSWRSNAPKSCRTASTFSRDIAPRNIAPLPLRTSTERVGHHHEHARNARQSESACADA
jgi:hypothetical protein